MLGFIQGRASKAYSKKIQEFPWLSWREEFYLACSEFSVMEWTLDIGSLYKNPIMTKEGQKIILSKISKTKLAVDSLTADFFMQRPFWLSNIEMTKIFNDVMHACKTVGIKIIVVPLVDESSITSIDLENRVINFFNDEIAESLEKLNLRVAFESDFEPIRLQKFINCFDTSVFGINYDIGNSACYGFNPDKEFQAYGEKIINVHIKDRKVNGPTIPLGMGDAEFKKVFKLLRSFKYNENLILQCARKRDNGLKDLMDYKSFLIEHNYVNEI